MNDAHLEELRQIRQAIQEGNKEAIWRDQVARFDARMDRMVANMNREFEERQRASDRFWADFDRRMDLWRR